MAISRRQNLWARWAILLAMLALAPATALAVGLNEEDIYDWASPPADLPRPSSALTGSICFDRENGTTVVVASCVVIQPDWVLTAAHVHPWNEGRYVLIDGERYDIADAFIPPTLGGGLAVARIETTEGDPADLEEFIGFGDPIVGTVITVGGFGDTFDYSQSPPLENEPGILRWGRNTLLYKNEGLLKHFFDAYEEADYVKYECTELNHDSGSGWYFREPYGWRLVGIVGASESGWNAYWYKQDVIDAIDNYPGYDYIEPDYGPPAADNSWASQSSGSWSVGANWSAGVPDADEVVYLDGDFVGPVISSGYAQANELHIGHNSDEGYLHQSGGTLSVGEVLVMGPGGGFCSLTGGSMSVPKMYIGTGGMCMFEHAGGTLNVSDVLYLGAWFSGSGTARYELLGGGAVLNADRILFGLASGCGGLITMDTSTECHAKCVILGVQGGGDFRQYGGTCTIDNLEIAFGPDTNCSYRLYGGALEVGDLMGGRGEDAQGSLIVSGGTMTVANLNSDTWHSGHRFVKGKCSVTQTGGSVEAERIKVHSDNSYALSGGTLTVTDWADVDGPLDFGNGSATLVCDGTVDLQDSAVTNAGNASIEVHEEMLLILPVDFDVENDLGTLVNDGIVHIAGQTLVIADGDGFTSSHAHIHDAVEVQGTGHIQASEGGFVNMDEGVTVGSQGTVDLRAGSLGVANGTSTVDDPSYFRSRNISVAPGSKLIANGALIATCELRMNGTLEIGPGVASLTIQDSLAWLAAVPGSICMDIRGLDAGEADYLTLDSEYMGVFALDGFTLDIVFADGFEDDVCPGDEVELISFPAGCRDGGFAEITHDGPVGLLVDAEYDDQNGKIGVAFSSWNPGDVTLDGFVGQDDLDIVLHHWGESGQNITWREGDVSGNHSVDQADLDLVLDNWGESME